MADEQGETYHIHVFFVSSSPIRFTTVKNKFPTAHIETAQGSCAENKAYIQKSGKWEQDKKHGTSIPDTFEEWGEMPTERQGSRSDLELLYKLIKNGKSNFEILEEYPGYLLRLTDIEKTRQTLRTEEFRNTFRKLTVIYIYGAPGTGKTRSVMDKYGYENVYRVTEYEHPFDSYQGQEVLLLDEYRSQLRISDILNLLDGYPMELRCRYTNKTACFTTVYIISNVDLYSQYNQIQLEQPSTWQAFLRRIHKVEQFLSDGRIKYYTTEEYLHSFIEVDP